MRRQHLLHSRVGTFGANPVVTKTKDNRMSQKLEQSLCANVDSNTWLRCKVWQSFGLVLTRKTTG